MAQLNEVVWTEDKLEKIKGLVTEQLSARQIGERLGVSRNAIIGVCRRKGIMLNGAMFSVGLEPRLQRRPPQQRIVFRLPPKPQERSRPHLLPDPKLRCDVFALNSERCHFPLWGEDLPAFKDQFYCGSPTQADSAYCHTHHTLTHKLIYDQPRSSAVFDGKYAPGKSPELK